MAQKKVILKDGGNDLLPKTLASMVFTEAGQTVEEALQNAGGGSSSGGGTGNVKVTNGSSLQKNAYYAFQPSAAGSLTGKFATLPYASSKAAGLMSSNDYRKLVAIKEERELPSSVVSLSSSSTELDTAKAMMELIDGEESGTIEDLDDNVRNFVALYWGVYVQLYTGDNADQVLTYHHSRISLVPTYTPPESGEGNQYQKASLELTYVSSGRLRTTTLTATLNSSGDTATYDFKAKVEESGDDTYYLPSGVIGISNPVTTESLQSVFGITYRELAKAVNGKKVYIYDNSQPLLLCPHIPVSVQINLGLYCYLSWVESSCIYKTLAYAPSSSFSEIYLGGYPLKPEVYSLTSSSDTDTISTAVGGESGLKAIIQAVKDGNRLVIRGTPPSGLEIGTLSTDVLMNQYKESENGDIQITYTLFGWRQGGGYLGGSIYVLNYTKSSNTFSIGNANFQVSS